MKWMQTLCYASMYLPFAFDCALPHIDRNWNDVPHGDSHRLLLAIQPVYSGSSSRIRMDTNTSYICKLKMQLWGLLMNFNIHMYTIYEMCLRECHIQHK